MVFETTAYTNSATTARQLRQINIDILAHPSRFLTFFAAFHLKKLGNFGLEEQIYFAGLTITVFG